MVNRVTNAEEMTGLNDTVHKSKEKLREGNSTENVKKGFKLSDKQKAAIVLGTVLLGGSAFIAIDQVDGKPVEPVIPTPTPINNTASADSTSVAQPIKVGETQEVGCGTLCPTDEVAIAHSANDTMTFEDAFAASREEVGPGGVFNWHGNTYNTFYKAEWNGLSLNEKQDFLHDVGFDIAKENVAKNDNLIIINIFGSPTPATPEPLFEPIVKEIMVDGKPTYAIDSDGDGFVDALVSVDEVTGTPVALLDEFGDNSLDTIAMLDPTTLEPIMTAPMEQTFEIAMDDVDSISEEMMALGTGGTDGVLDSTTVSANNLEGENEGDIEDENEDLVTNEDYHGNDNVDEFGQ